MLILSKLTHWIYRSLFFFFITYPCVIELVDLPYIGHHHLDGSVKQTGQPQDGAGAVRRGHVVTFKKKGHSIIILWWFDRWEELSFLNHAVNVDFSWEFFFRYWTRWCTHRNIKIMLSYLKLCVLCDTRIYISTKIRYTPLQWLFYFLKIITVLNTQFKFWRYLFRLVSS